MNKSCQQMSIYIAQTLMGNSALDCSKLIHHTKLSNNN